MIAYLVKHHYDSGGHHDLQDVGDAHDRNITSKVYCYKVC